MWKQSNKKLVSGIALSSLLVLSCQPMKGLKDTNTVAVPGNYNIKTDSVAVASRKWEDYFTDNNLKVLIDTVMKNSPDLKIAYQRILAAQSGVMSAKGALAPSVGINTFAGGTKYGRHTMDGAGNYSTPEVPYPIVPAYMLGVSASWEVDIWGKLKNKRKAAQLKVLSSQYGLQWLETVMVSSVAAGYYELIALDEELEIIDRNILLQQKALEIVQVQKDAGRATSLAVKQFEAQLQQTKALFYQVKSDIYTKEAEINSMMGNYQQRINRSKSIFDIKLPKVTEVGVPSNLLDNRPDIAQAGMELKASRADVLAAKAAFYPSLNISGNTGYSTYKTNLFYDPNSMAYALIGNVAGPLVNRKAVKSNFNKSMAEHYEAYEQYRKTVVNAVNEVSTDINKINNMQGEYDMVKRQVVTLTEAVTIAQDLYKSGYANYLEVITAQKNLLDAELQKVKTRKEVFLSLIGLYRSLGGGWK